MSRIPQPAPYSDVSRPWRDQVLPADYSDEVTDEDFDALRKFVASEIGPKDLEVADGPAW